MSEKENTDSDYMKSKLDEAARIQPFFPEPNVEYITDKKTGLKKAVRTKFKKKEDQLDAVRKQFDSANVEEEYQGEMCFRGRPIMSGYMAQPKLGYLHVQETEIENMNTIDDFGWLHTGDKGFMTENGFLTLSGRFKELIISAGGENIAPVPIEDYFRSICPVVSNLIMIGDKRPYNVALVTLKTAGSSNGELPGTNALEGPSLNVDDNVKTLSNAKNNEAFHDLIRE